MGTDAPAPAGGGMETVLLGRDGARTPDATPPAGATERVGASVPAPAEHDGGDPATWAA